jgi:hypothetical protein
MKYSALFLLFSGLILATNASANIKLSLSENALLLAINGQKINPQKGKSLLSNTKSILSNGQNQVLVKYQGIYQANSAYYFFRSNPIVITFTAKDSDIELTLPNLTSFNDTSLFNRAPMLTLINKKNGQAVPFKQGLLQKPHTNLVGLGYIDALEQYNRSNSLAAVPPKLRKRTIMLTSSRQPQLSTTLSPTVDITSNIPKLSFSSQAVKINKNKTSDDAIIATMLNYWYNQANENTKATFKEKLVSQ